MPCLRLTLCAVRGSGLGDLSPTVMDPECRCAAMLVYGSQLAVMPFRAVALAKKVVRVLRSSRPAAGEGRRRRREGVVGLGIESATISAAMVSRRKRKRGRDKAGQAGEGVGDSTLEIGEQAGGAAGDADANGAANGGEGGTDEEDDEDDDEDEEEDEGGAGAGAAENGDGGKPRQRRRQDDLDGLEVRRHMTRGEDGGAE